MIVTSNKSVKKSLIAIALILVVSYLLVFVYSNIVGELSGLGATTIAAIYMFIPAVVTTIVQKFIYREPLKKPFGISLRFNKWFLIAWLFPVFFAFLTLGISFLFPGIEFAPEMAAIAEQNRTQITPEQLEQARNQIASFPVHPIWTALSAGLIAGPTINAVFAFGEELGWRGLLLRELSFMGFWKSSVIIGFTWGIWHAPLILHGLNYPQHPIAGVFMMIAVSCLLSIILNYLTIKGRSVIVAAIAHGTINALPFLAISVVKGGNDLTTGLTGLAGLLAMVVIITIILIYERIFAKRPILIG